ncbi:MAG TPA: hypothetical protein VK306_02910 [Acidimicrobiales bacterium]|nr:hypothetical protein [Acidimicrobiales bacterium]
MLGSLLAGAGLVHLVMAPSHMAESAVEGVGFFAAGWLQLALAVSVVCRPARAVLQGAVVADMAFAAVWAASRTAGLPVGDHAGHAEAVTFVDATTVALELAAVAVAALLLARRRPGLPSGGPLALAAPLVVVALTTAVVASPGARDHAAGAHGDHPAGHAHGDEAAAGDDKGLSLLRNGHQHDTGVVAIDARTQAALDEQLDVTRRLAEEFPTIADAEAAGYRRAGPFAPGLGTHYIAAGISTTDTGLLDAEALRRPTLIYDGLDPGSPLSGFMYLVASDTEPEGFAGPNDHWHYHEAVCIVARADGGVDTPFGADLPGVTSAMCDEVGGAFIENTGYMVHVWTVPGYETEAGTFTEINPRVTCPDGTYYMVPIEDIAYRESACRSA